MLKEWTWTNIQLCTSYFDVHRWYRVLTHTYPYSFASWCVGTAGKIFNAVVSLGPLILRYGATICVWQPLTRFTKFALAYWGTQEKHNKLQRTYGQNSARRDTHHTFGVGGQALHIMVSTRFGGFHPQSSSIFMGFSLRNPPFWGYPHGHGNPQISRRRHVSGSLGGHRGWRSGNRANGWPSLWDLPVKGQDEGVTLGAEPDHIDNIQRFVNVMFSAIATIEQYVYIYIYN